MIVFPRIMPAFRVAAQSFEIGRVDFQSPEADGYLGGMQAGFPVWLTTVTFNSMRLDEGDRLRAFLGGQRGAQRQFFAFDVDRQRPRFHGSGRPYNPTPASWSQAIDADGTAVLTLTGLLSGQVVGLGDYVGFAWTKNGVLRTALTRSQQSAVATGSGMVSVEIEPPLPPVVPAGAAANLDRPGCLMKLVTGETKLARQDLGFLAAGSTIVAAQDYGR